MYKKPKNRNRNRLDPTKSLLSFTSSTTNISLYHTIHISVKQAMCHKILPFRELLKPQYEMTIMLHIVTNSLSRPQHHMGRILPWAQESPSSPYLRRGNVLEPCGDFFDQSYVEGSRRFRRSPHLCGRVWKNVEPYGRPWNVGESSRDFHGSLVNTCTW